jgi:hypothetical protein
MDWFLFVLLLPGVAMIFMRAVRTTGLLRWSLNNNGTLMIGDMGAMPDYSTLDYSSNSTHWYSCRSSVKKASSGQNASNYEY